MSWCFRWYSTEELQEANEVYKKLSKDNELGDTYQALCKEKQKAIEKELAKRKAALESGRSIV